VQKAQEILLYFFFASFAALREVFSVPVYPD